MTGPDIVNVDPPAVFYKIRIIGCRPRKGGTFRFGPAHD